MDQELIAYLDQRFGEVNQRFDEVDRRFGEVDQRFQENSEQFRGLRQEIQDLRESTDKQFREVREENRHTRILVEDLRDDVRLLAEVVDANDEKTERRFEALEAALARETAEIRSLLKLSYSALDQRVQALEAKAS